MDLNSESSEGEASANDGCVILDVRRAATPIRKRRRRKRLTLHPKRHKQQPRKSLRLLDAVAVEPQPPRPAAATATSTAISVMALSRQKRARTKEDRESDAAASNSESDHEDGTKESRAFRRVIRRTREAIPSDEERVAFDALPEHEQFAFTPKRRRAAPNRFHIKTNRGTVGNLHRSYDAAHEEDTDPVEGWGAVRSEFGGSPQSTSSWNDTDDEYHAEVGDKKATRPRVACEPTAPLRSDEGWLLVSSPKKPETQPQKELSTTTARVVPVHSSGMQSPPGIVYNALLVQPDGKPGITMPRFTLPDGRAACQTQVSWIPVRYLEMLLHAKTAKSKSWGAVPKMLQRMGLSPTVWTIGSAAVTKGELTQANADFIICTFRSLFPCKDDPRFLHSRTRVVSLIPIASATTICRERGASPESVAFLRAFAPRELSFATVSAPPAPPAPQLQPVDDDDDDDDDENSPLSERTAPPAPQLPPAPPAPPAPLAVARASWRVPSKPTAPAAPAARSNSWTNTLAAHALTSLSGGTTTSIATGGLPVDDSDQDSNATEAYGALPHPNLAEIVRMPRSLQPPYDAHVACVPPQCASRTTTTANPIRPESHAQSRPHPLQWERRSSLELSGAAKRELEAQARRAPAKRAPHRFSSKFKSQRCRNGSACRFRASGCAFVHPEDTNEQRIGVNNHTSRSNEWGVERDTYGNILRPFHELDRF